MKILQICNKLPYPPNDGGAIATFNNSISFTKLGHEVTILSLNTKKHYFEINNIPDEYSKKIKFIGVDIDTTIKATKALKNLLFSKLPYNAERFLSDEFSKKITKILKENKFDVIQIEGLYMGLYIDIIRKYSNALISLRAHNIEHEIWQRTHNLESNYFKKYYLKIIAGRVKNLKKALINKYDVLVTITDRDKSVFEKFKNSKPVITSQVGIDIQKLSQDTSSIDYNSIFHIGALDWTPNQEGLIWFINNVWKEIYRKNNNIKFRIAGRNCPDWLKNKFNMPGIEFFGEIDDAYKFIRQNAIMIVPLFSGSGMRVKIIEGLALGKTIISTPIGAEGIDYDNGNNIVIVDKATDFLNNINKLINNIDEIDRIGKNAVNFAKEKFDNNSIAKDLIDFYQKNIK